MWMGALPCASRVVLPLPEATPPVRETQAQGTSKVTVVGRSSRSFVRPSVRFWFVPSRRSRRTRSALHVTPSNVRRLFSSYRRPARQQPTLTDRGCLVRHPDQTLHPSTNPPLHHRRPRATISCCGSSAHEAGVLAAQEPALVWLKVLFHLWTSCTHTQPLRWSGIRPVHLPGRA